MVDHPQPVPKGDIWSATRPPETRAVPIDQTVETQRLSRAMHPKNLAEEADPNATIPTWLGGTLQERPTHLVDRRPRDLLANKYVDDGGKWPMRTKVIADPGSFDNAADAERYLDEMTKRDPDGGWIMIEAHRGSTVHRGYRFLVRRGVDLPVGMGGPRANT